MTLKHQLYGAALALCVLSLPAIAADGRTKILADLAAEAKSQSETFTGFSADRGLQLYLAVSKTGKPDTPSCTSCHSQLPTNIGQTRAGKAIEPMALSKTPIRYSDPEKVEKWFGRNCNSVLGRLCTATEKGDFITFMTTQ